MKFHVPFNTVAFLDLLSEYRDSIEDPEKLKSLSEANWEKLIYMEEDGYLVSELHKVSTGRYHTSSPNIQGMPKAVRSCIQESDRVMMWCDWVASHPNLLAKISGDKQLLEDLESDPYSVFPEFDRKTVKLFMLLMLNGSGNKRLSEVCNISDFEVGKLRRLMKRRWGRAISEIENWKREAEKKRFVEVWGYKIEVKESYKAPAFVLQYIEAQNMKWVSKQHIDGARVSMTVHDEILWSVEPEMARSVSRKILELMGRFGRCELEYGSAWCVPDKKPCAPYTNPNDRLFREFYDLKDDYNEFGEDDLLDGKYIPCLGIPGEGNHHIFLKSPKGTGKTQAFKRAVESFLDNGKRILSITPIRSLAKEQSVKIGLPHYKEDYEGAIDGSAVLVINSILRVEGAVDILFLDEITAILACIKHKGTGRASGTIPDSEVEQVLMKLKQIIMSARVVICADADLNGYAIDFVRESRSFSDSSEVFDVVKLEREDKRVLYRNDKILKDKILQDLGRGAKIWIASTSKGEVKKIHKMIQAVYPNKRGIVLHSDSEDKENIIANLDSTILEIEPDYVVVSPTVQAGVSVDLDGYFDYVAGFYRSGIMISSTFDQMLGRVRKPISKIAHVWVDKRNMRGATDPSVVLDNLYNRDRICAAAIGYVARLGSPEKIVYTSKGYRTIQSKESEIYNRFYSAQIAMENARGGSCATDGYLAYLRANEVQYMWIEDDDPSKRIIEAYKDATEAVKQQDIQNVREAEEISMMQAKNLVEEETTPEERNQIARAYILNTYGEVSEETIKLYDDGKGRKAIKSLALLVDLIQGGDWVTHSDLWQRKEGLSCATYQNDTSFILTISDILQDFGVISSSGIPIYAPLASVPTTRIRNYVSLLSDLGFKIDPRVAIKHPARMISSILKRIGLKLKSKQVQIKGVRARQYSLDREHTEFILETPYWAALQDKREEYNQDRSKIVRAPVESLCRYRKINRRLDGSIHSVVLVGSNVEIPFSTLHINEQAYLLSEVHTFSLKKKQELKSVKGWE